MAELYTVRRIDELTRLSDVGLPEKFYRHQIKTKGGVILTVNISEKDFTPEKVAPILAKKAEAADKILGL